MGIFIYLKLSPRVTKKEWSAVYEETLKLVEAFPLARMVRREFYGVSTFCAVKTEECMDSYGRTGWWADGDMETLGTAERYFVPKHLGIDTDTNEPQDDALLGLAASCTDIIEWENPRCKNLRELFGDKTQGEYYHRLLLAVGCFIVDRLGKKASIFGDITKGQCAASVDMANKVLDKPIQVPPQCDMQRFFDRIKGMSLSPLDEVVFFTECILANKDEKLGHFMQKYFSMEQLKLYWMEQMKERIEEKCSLKGILKEYVTMDFPICDWCRYVKELNNGEADYFENAITDLLDLKLHKEEKYLEDWNATDQDHPGLYGIGTLFGKAIFGGLRNYHVNKYIPVEELQAILREVFSDQCKVEEIVEKYLAEERKAEEEGTDEEDAGLLFNRMMDEMYAVRCDNKGEFDITDMENLECFEAGDTLEPRLEKAVKESFQFYTKAAEEDKFKELVQGEHSDRCRFLVESNKRLLLRESDWIHIFEEIEKDKSSYKRYYPMVRVVAEGDLQNMVRAFVLNDEFYAFCSNLIKDEGMR